MTHRFGELMFAPTVKSVQEAMGSRASYARFEAPDAPARDRFTAQEAAFIAARDTFYMATVSETGWPYVQHRGGPPGFLKVLDERTLGFADYRGNKQYVSVGNLLTDDRVSLFLVDYPARRRLKILGHARALDGTTEPDLLQRLRDDYDARVERGILITLEGFDWNCPQHITPRFTEAEIAEALVPLHDRLRSLEAENAALRARLTEAPSEPGHRA
jgi:predicted pyridoxine 5'-phosphate oxidase superfamily flavin-nucleotide-binding protein